MNTRPARQRRPLRGVSLIDALVALAVMAFGMLGIVGLQFALRLSSDVAKQRSEAVRLSQQSIEDSRSFSTLAAAPPMVAYDDIIAASATVAGYATNTTYTLSREVLSSDFPAARMKTMRVVVAWADRSNATPTDNQRIELNSTIAGISPALTGTLGVPGNVGSDGYSTRPPRGRHRAIPNTAVQIPNTNSSGFRPPQPTGGTVAWVFDNTTGIVTVCQSAATATEQLASTAITSCSPNTALIVRGFVRFAYNTTPTAAVAENPGASVLNLDMAITLTSSGNPAPGAQCFDDAPSSSIVGAGSTVVSYYCVVYTNSSGQWSGISSVVPLGQDGAPPWVIAAAGAGAYKVCRYTAANSDAAANSLHPRDYSNVTSADLLINQNFLVIAANDNCPSDVAADPANGDFVNSNTRQHQP